MSRHARVECEFRAINSYCILPLLLRCQAKSCVISYLRGALIHSVAAPLWHASCLYYSMSINGSDEIDDREWRRLCQLAAKEYDPQRLSELVDQLIRALDARRNALPSSEPRGKSPASPASAED
jgi:hypothetical protein